MEVESALARDTASLLDRAAMHGQDDLLHDDREEEEEEEEEEEVLLPEEELAGDGDGMDVDAEPTNAAGASGSSSSAGMTGHGAETLALLERAASFAEELQDGLAVPPATANGKAAGTPTSHAPPALTPSRGSLGTKLAPVRTTSDNEGSDEEFDDDDDEDDEADGLPSSQPKTNGSRKPENGVLSSDEDDEQARPAAAQAQLAPGQDDDMDEDDAQDEEQDPTILAKMAQEKDTLTAQMNSIEAEYSLLRLKLHKARVQKLSDNLKRLREGTHRGLRKIVAQYKSESAKSRRTAEYRRGKQLDNIGLILDAQKRCAENDLLARTEQLQTKYWADLRHRRAELLEGEKTLHVKLPKSFNMRPKRKPKKKFVPYVPHAKPRGAGGEKLANGFRTTVGSKSKRTIGGGGGGGGGSSEAGNAKQKRRRRVRAPVVSTPFVVYMLTETQIMKDLRYMSTTRSRFKSSVS